MAEEKPPKEEDKKEDKNNEDGDKKTDKGSGGSLTSPEGILMLCVAGLLDGIGFMLFLLSWLGIDDYGILDIIGGIIIGGWLFMRNGSGAASGALKRFLTAFGIEAIPFLGGISPSWIIIVWKELKS